MNGKNTMKSSPPRRVIPDDQCIVVIDTSPIRNIAESGFVPPWVGTFAAMVKDGYSFSLADVTFAELLSQRLSGQNDGDYDLMISSLHGFLNPEFPVLPGKTDIMQMIGAKPCREGWSEAEVRRMSQHAWGMLLTATLPAANPALLSTLSTNSTIGAAQAQEFLEQMLQEERDAWIRMHSDLKARWEANGRKELHEYEHSELDDALVRSDHGEAVVPSMTVRNDFQVRFMWRQFVRNQKTKNPYNPSSRKKRNDGIDFDFLLYLALPAFFLAEEQGFDKTKIGEIPSFQTNWILAPQELADAWTKGDKPWAKWPTPAKTGNA